MTWQIYGCILGKILLTLGYIFCSQFFTIATDLESSLYLSFKAPRIGRWSHCGTTNSAKTFPDCPTVKRIRGSLKNHSYPVLYSEKLTPNRDKFSPPTLAHHTGDGDVKHARRHRPVGSTRRRDARHAECGLHPPQTPIPGGQPRRRRRDVSSRRE